jgi:hypothetical protein
MQARLDAGQDASLVGELRRHLTAYPLRERTWAQLMLAPYRGGDTGGALAAYRQARTVLAEQLGIEPGSELVGLHRAMLDRSADLAGSGPARPTAGRPRQARSPLALRIAASRLAAQPWLSVHALTEALRDPGERLEWLAYEDLSIRQSLATAYTAVGAAEPVAARAFGLFGETADALVPAEWIAARLHVSTARAVRALDALVDAHLAEQEPAGYRLRPLVRDYAAVIAAQPHVPRRPQLQRRSDSALRSA